MNEDRFYQTRFGALTDAERAAADYHADFADDWDSVIFERTSDGLRFVGSDGGSARTSRFVAITDGSSLSSTERAIRPVEA